MKTINNIIALIPMRHESERVVGKNYRNFAGKPLFHHITSTLLEVSLLSRIVIDTDSQTIKNYILEYFPTVEIIERPQHLRNGDVPMNDVILHDISVLDSDFFLQTHSTNPLLKAETITKAIEYFFESYPEKDSLFSVSKFQKRLWNSTVKAVNHVPTDLIRTQDLEPLYEENSCMYIFNRKVMAKLKNRIGNKPVMFETDKIESFDIDDELDFLIAENIYKCLQESTIS